MTANYFKKLFAELDAFYSNVHTCGNHDDNHLSAIDISEWRKVYIELAKKVHEGKINKTEVNDDVVRLTYDGLNSGAEKGYGKGWNEQENHTQVKELQKNLYKFSCAKDLTVTERINTLLVKDGKVRDFESFKNLVLKENVKYNIQYLKTEYKTALQATGMAKQWEEYQRNKKNYPNLKYKTQGDAKVRDTHVALQDRIIPIDDSFWRSYYPPNGWNCRCYVEQTNEPATDIPTKINNVPIEFENNVGISGQIFKEKEQPHPYFALLKSDANYKKAFEFAKLLPTAYKKIQKFDNGSIIYDNLFSDTSDFDKNLNSAKILCKNHKNTIVKIRPHLDGSVLENWTSPEYEINGLLADRYEGKIENGLIKKTKQIKSFISKYNEQFDKAINENYSILFDTTQINDYNEKAKITDLGNLLFKKFNIGTRLNSIIIVHGQKTIIINRDSSLQKIYNLLVSIYKKK